MFSDVGTQEVGTIGLEGSLPQYYPGEDGWSGFEIGKGWTPKSTTPEVYKIFNSGISGVNDKGEVLRVCVSLIKTGITLVNLGSMGFDLSGTEHFLASSFRAGERMPSSSTSVDSLVTVVSPDTKSTQRLINVSFNRFDGSVPQQKAMITYKIGEQTHDFIFDDKNHQYRAYPLGKDTFALQSQYGKAKILDTYKIDQDGKLNKLDSTSIPRGEDNGYYYLENIRSIDTNIIASTPDHKTFVVSGPNGKLVRVDAGINFLSSEKTHALAFVDTIVPVGSDTSYAVLNQDLGNKNHITVAIFDSKQVQSGKVFPISNLEIGKDISTVDKIVSFRNLSANSTPTDSVVVQFTTDKGQRLLKVFEVTDSGKLVSEGVSVIKSGIDVDGVSIVNGESTVLLKDGTSVKTKMFLPKQ